MKIMIDNFMMDNRGDVDFLLSDRGREAIVKTHIEGIIHFLSR